MQQLNRIERAALVFLRNTGQAADVRNSGFEAGLLTLRDADGRLLAQICDGIEVTASEAQGVGMAIVQPFVLRVRCFRCDRSTVRSSTQWVAGELWECRCGARNVLPRDPLSATREG